MDTPVDKDTFTAAVFRRGNKQELLHPSSSNAGKQEDGLSLPEQVTGDEKLEELLKLWSLPRSGKDLAAAIWRPSRCAAQVVLQKGRLFAHVGCSWGGHLYLTIEEAVYMVDRGSMLMFYEDSKTKKKTLMSMKECYALMESCGVSMDHFITYCKLLRAGYIAHRTGLPWLIKSKNEVKQYNCTFKGNLVRKRNNVVERNASHGPKERKQRIEAPCDEGKVSTVDWWPEYQWYDNQEKKMIPKCIVINEKTKEQKRLGLFPRMAPLGSHEPLLHKKSDESEYMYLDVYPPNSTFSRKQTGPLSSVLSMAACNHEYPPSSDTIHEIEACTSSSENKVRFVGVEHGDIAFYSFFRTTLRDIH